MGQKALIVWGGWLGHEPEQVAGIFRELLEEEQFDVEIADSLDAFSDGEKLKSLDLIIPIWTMGEIGKAQAANVSAAVQSGVGLAGCHGGMCDAFRTNVDWQFMTGGQWVAHPGNAQVTYTVNIKHSSSPLLEGIEDFEVTTEQYYMHIDPAIEVLATTRFPVAPGPHVLNKAVDMPVVWTKRWGVGRVFYCSLGHNAAVAALPQMKLIMKRGFLWAAEGKRKAAASAAAQNPSGAYTGMADSQV